MRMWMESLTVPPLAWQVVRHVAAVVALSMCESTALHYKFRHQQYKKSLMMLPIPVATTILR
jgi:hypothetical protein